MALDRQQVVAAAIELVNDEGLDALSLRTLAARLGVQAPTLYWHVKNKSALVDAVADAVMDDAITGAAELDGADADWLLGALGRLRVALLRQRDGARAVSGARYSLRRGDFSELAMSTLVAQGIPAQRARLLVLAGERFTFGWVLEEQSAVPDGPAPDAAEIRQRFPVLTEAIGEYFATPGRTADDLFVDVARLIVGSPEPRSRR